MGTRSTPQTADAAPGPATTSGPAAAIDAAAGRTGSLLRVAAVGRVRNYGTMVPEKTPLQIAAGPAGSTISVTDARSE